MAYITNQYMVTHNAMERFEASPRQAPPWLFRHRFRQPYPVYNTPNRGLGYMGDNSWHSERLPPQYWNGFRQVTPQSDWEFTEDVSLTWNTDPSAYFEGLEQTVPPCKIQFAEDWSTSWCDLSKQLYPQQQFPQKQILLPTPPPLQNPVSMLYPVHQLSPWPQGPMRRRHQKKMQRVEEPYRRPPSSTAVCQTVSTQLKQMKPSLQSLLVTWKQDKLELAAICVAVYDDDCLTKILWLDKPGTHVFMLFGNKGVKIEMYGLGKVVKNNDAYFVSVSGRQTLKVTHTKDYSEWETVVLRRKTCDHNLLDAFLMKESFQIHPTRMEHTHYKMTIENPDAQTEEHNPVDHSENNRPRDYKMITPITARPTHVSTLAQSLLQSACNCFEPPTTAYTGLKTDTMNTTQNPIFQTSSLLDITVDRTFRNALDIISAVRGSTQVNIQQKHGKSDANSKCTTQDIISTEKTLSNVSQALNNLHTSLYPLVCSDSLSELSGSPSSTDDTDAENFNTCTSLPTTITLGEVNRNITQSGMEALRSNVDSVLTAFDGANMGTSGITSGNASRHDIGTGETRSYGVVTGDATRYDVKGDPDRCVAEVGALTPSEVVAPDNSISSENVADISSFLVLDSTGDNLTKLDIGFAGDDFLDFEEFDETLQAPVKKLKVGNGEVRIFEAPAQDKVKNLKSGKKRPLSEISNRTVGGNISSKQARNRWRKIVKAKKKVQKNVKADSPSFPPRFDHEHKEMLLLLRFYKSGKVYFIRGCTENGGLDIPFSLLASEKYEARMLELDTQTASLRTFSIKGVSNFLTFTTSLTVEHLERLQEMAEEFISSSQSKYHHLKHFYRNKPPPYFGDIFYNHNGVMKPYLKDYNGDQLSPINGKLNGLFFSASVKFSTGKVPANSCFGAKRLYVPAEVLFDGNTCLYFTDFYCTSSKGPHYVTLVMTRQGSEADIFCQTRLRQLNPFNNPFLYKKNCAYGWQVFTCTCSVCLNIEVFYTENVDIKWLLDRHRNNAYFETVGTFGQGHSSLMGIPKNTKCKVCNLKLGLPLKRQCSSENQ